MVHGIQIDRLGLMVSMQKSGLKNMHWIPGYYRKSVENQPCKPNQKIWLILANISGLGEYFSKQIFALKLWDWAGRFEYHEPYNLKKFSFTYKGVWHFLLRIYSYSYSVENLIFVLHWVWAGQFEYHEPYTQGVQSWVKLDYVICACSHMLQVSEYKVAIKRKFILLTW